MNKVQLYIQGTRVDLFEEEAVEVKRVIQDAKDIGKVFTDYSKPFLLPASATNNKIFKHFYNFHIDNGFDARIKQPGEIYLNYQLYKRGRIFLKTVNMKNNVPYSYEISFFGNTIKLSDQIGDDTLADLDLTDFDHTFSNTVIKNIFKGDGFTPNTDGPGLVVSGDTESLIYPLITSKKRLFYDSSLVNNDATNFSGNLYGFPETLRGVSEEDLKPAIKVYYIIKAIESKYDIKLIASDIPGTKDFFSRFNSAISNLYLWISNNAGNMIGRVDGNNYFFSAIYDNINLFPGIDDDFDFISASGKFITISSDFTDEFRTAGTNINFRVSVNPTSLYVNVPYRLFIRDEDNPSASVAVLEGTGAKKFKLTGSRFSGHNKDKRYFFELQSKSAMTGTGILFEAREEKPLETLRSVFTDSVDTDSSTVTIQSNMPDIKIMDFLDGLMKMFNLTAFVIDDETDTEYGVDSQGEPNVIKIVTLDDFYSDAVNNQSGGIIDITDYIDIQEHKVNTSLPFSEIHFKYEDSGTLLRENHKETFAEQFGDARYLLREEFKIDEEVFFGDNYEIKVPFEMLKYEHIRDLSDDSTTDIQWGYAAGGDFQATDAVLNSSNNVITPPKGDYQSKNIKPLLFYGIKVTGATNLNFINGAGSLAQVLDTYYRPSNTNELIAVDSEGFFAESADFHLTFDAEVDEFTFAPATEDTKSLFLNFYRSYIQSVFNKDKRIFNFNAFLPGRVLSTLKLNDQLKIQDVIYRINSITTNLVNGKTKLELINLAPEEIVE
tara:strand:+ start:2059 stop:4386 length:2328 start_codon:yes stop_codon:yes gene_type:complete